MGTPAPRPVRRAGHGRPDPTPRPSRGHGAAYNRHRSVTSRYAYVPLRGAADPATGFLRDCGEVDAALKAIRETLDHRLLNEI